MKGFQALLVMSISALLLVGCQTHPEPIEFGKDQCAYCKMTIADPKFGSELVTPKGRILKYDAAECMAQQIGREGQEHTALYAIAMDAPGKLKAVDSLVFVIHEDIKSPMGANLAAFHDAEKAAEFNAEMLSWQQLVEQLKK